MAAVERVLSFLIWVTALTLVSIPSAAMAAKDKSPFRQALKASSDSIEKVIEEYLSGSSAPGLAIVIVEGDEIVWSKGYGYTSVDKKERVTPETIFRIGSITKLFTATMLLQLRDDGELALDVSIEPLLPSQIVNNFPDPRPVTFRQLVTHTSGVPPEGGNYWNDMKIPPIEVLLAENPRISLLSPPLSAFRYSNFGIAIMARAMENIAGSSYEDFVVDRILRPLDMRNTSFYRPEGAVRRATGHLIKDGIASKSEDVSLNGLAPAGQLYSTANDLAKFSSLQLHSGPAGGKRILGSSSLREMRQAQFLFPNLVSPDPMGIAMGLGWFIRDIAGQPAVGHGGGIPGYSADITVVPQHGIASVILTNGGISPGRDPTTLNKKLLEKLVRHVQGLEREKRLAKAKFRDSWDEFLGEYDMAGVALLRIERRDGRMIFVHPMDKPNEEGVMFPDLQNDLFTLEGGIASGESIRFKRGRAGQVASLEIVGISAPKLD